MKLIVLALAATVACAAAHAQSATQAPAAQGRQPGVFLGAGIGSFAFQDDAGTTYGVGGLEVRGGYNFNKYLGLSVEALFPSQTYEGDGTSLYYTDNIDVDPAYGIYLEPRLPLGRVVGLYGRVGYFNTTIKNVLVNYGNGGCCRPPHNESVSALAYGGGIDFDFGGSVTIALDLTGYSSNIDSTAGAGLMLEKRF